MTVKEDKKKWNIPWKGIKISILIGALIGILVFLISYSVQSKNLEREANAIERNKIVEKKLDDIVSKNYNIVCKNYIIHVEDYAVIKVKNTYRVIVGEKTKELDKTFTVSECNVIYNITKGNKDGNKK